MKINQVKDYPDGLLTYIKDKYHFSPQTGMIYINHTNYSKPAYMLRSPAGYLRIDFIFNKKKYRMFAHRLAWWFYYGVFPTNVIDHINNDPADNRIINLRDVPISINSRRTHYYECGHCGNNIYDDLTRAKINECNI